MNNNTITIRNGKVSGKIGQMYVYNITKEQAIKLIKEQSIGQNGNVIGKII